MASKAQLLASLKDIYERWEALLSGLSGEQAAAPDRVAERSILDIVAHLTAWQQVSVARAEAALQDREPVYPPWPPELDPVHETNVDQVNAWVYGIYHGLPWPRVHREWRERFEHFLETVQAVPEYDLLDPGRFPWLHGYPLAAVLEGSLEHHREHLDQVLDLL